MVLQRQQTHTVTVYPGDIAQTHDSHFAPLDVQNKRSAAPIPMVTDDGAHALRQRRRQLYVLRRQRSHIQQQICSRHAMKRRGRSRSASYSAR